MTPLFSIVLVLVTLMSSAMAANPPVPIPPFKHIMTVTPIFGLNQSYFTTYGGGLVRGAFPIIGGTMTDPNGKSLGVVVPGFGGQFPDNWPDATSTINFRALVKFNDGAVGYIEANGFRTGPTTNEFTATIETNTTTFPNLNAKSLYSPGLINPATGEITCHLFSPRF